jgi:hypothetical protein
LDIYIWVAMSGLGAIEVKRGLDKNFAQVASKRNAPLKPKSGLNGPPVG